MSESQSSGTEPESTSPSPTPFESGPRAVPVPGRGCSRMALAGCGLTGLILALGMLVLILFTLFYEFTTSYNIHEEIERDNTAVGVALAANIIAIGIVVFKAVFGNFVGWTEGLIGFVVFAVIGFIVLLIVRWLFDFVLHPRADVSHEIAVDQNLGFAFLEGSVVISASMILFFAI